MRHSILKTLALVCVTGISCSAFSASRYVEESYGSDAGANDCRNRNTPCATIGYAISQAGPNDRVIVGPGSYQPSSQLNLIPGLKLTSVAGASSTVIDGTAISGAHVLFAGFADKVVIGQKRRGFTILADTSVTQAIIWINASNGARIEGNRFVSPVNTVTSAIDITNSDKITIRYNDIYSTGSGVFTNGVRTFSLGGVDNNKQWNISDNRLRNITDCIEVGSTAVNNANKVTKNRLDDCLEKGIEVRNLDDTLSPVISSRDKVSGQRHSYAKPSELPKCHENRGRKSENQSQPGGCQPRVRGCYCAHSYNARGDYQQYPAGPCGKRSF